MRRMFVIAALTACLCLPFAEIASAQDASVDTVLKAIGDQWSKIDSMTASLSWKAGYTPPAPPAPAAPATPPADGQAAAAPAPAAPPQIKLDLVGQGTFEYLKKEGKPLSRLDISGGFANSKATPGTIKVVYDGVSAAAEVTLFNKTQVHPFSVPSGGDSTQLILDLLKKYFALTAKPEEEVDGVKAYVLEGTPTFDIPKEVPATSMRAWFSKEQGVPVKLEIYDPDGRAMLTASFTNINMNVPVPEDHFVVPVEPPPALAVDVQAAPGANAPAAPAPAAAAPATEKPADAKPADAKAEKKDAPKAEKKDDAKAEKKADKSKK